MNRENDAGLERWELNGTEVARLINEFEVITKESQTPLEKHHENTPAFQKWFVSDVKKLESGFPCNPFEINDLVKINNTEVRYNIDVYDALYSLVSTGESKFLDFFYNRLIKGKEGINDPIKKNVFLLPGKVVDKQKKESDKMNYSINTLTKLREAIHNRPNLTIFDVAQSFAENSKMLYHGTKSDVLKCFTSHNALIIKKEDSSMLHDLSILVKSQGQYVQTIKSFNDLSKHLYSRILKASEGYKRCDLVTDRYFSESLKGNIRNVRGLGTAMTFNGEMTLPRDFMDFLGNSENKNNLNEFLVKRFLEEHLGTQTLVVTYKDSIISNKSLLSDEDITNCMTEEAGQRLVRHAYNCIRNGILSVVVSTNATDVVMLLIANFPHMIIINSRVILYCSFGPPDNKRIYNINELAEEIGYEKCRGFSFFHAFTGCDTVSSFFRHGKAVFLNCWLKSENKDLTVIFQQLSNIPVDVNDAQLNVLDKFVMDVYYPKRKITNQSLSELRLENFLAIANMDLRLLPPSKKGLYQHTLRACIQGGWINRECQGNVLVQDPINRGWNKVNDVFIPNWQNSNDIEIDVTLVTTTCTCRTALCKKCKCVNKKMLCLPFCGCRGKCTRP